jgi:hypothetical protein
MACTRHGSCYPAWQGSRSGPTVTLLLSGLCSRRCLLHATLNMFSITGPILHQSALLDPLQVGCVSDQAVMPTHTCLPPSPCLALSPLCVVLCRTLVTSQCGGSCCSITAPTATPQ